jgi:hypothetical protein
VEPRGRYNFGSDSDGDDAFRWDLFEQTALIQRRVNELFGFEPKSRLFEDCCMTKVA